MRVLINTGLFILFIIIVLAVVSFWKGGEPIKWMGEMTVSIGEAIVDLGESVDDFIGSQK